MLECLRYAPLCFIADVGYALFFRAPLSARHIVTRFALPGHTIDVFAASFSLFSMMSPLHDAYAI